MPSHRAQNGGTLAVDGDERARFCASMTEGLHAMAQPLTILRSSLVACTTPGFPQQKQHKYLELASEQVLRACTLFESLQDLVIANQIAAECGPIHVTAIIAAVVEEQKPRLRDLGIEISVPTTLEALPTALGDVGRTAQAIQAGLTTAAAVSSSGDVIRISATLQDRSIEVNIGNDRLHGASLNSASRLSLLLAEANILSQQGEFDSGQDPFRVRVALPRSFRGS